MKINKISIAMLLLCFCLIAKAQQLKLNWFDQIGGPGWDVLSEMAISKDGKLVVAGSFYDSLTLKDKIYRSNGSRDCFIAIYNTDGSVDKSLAFGGKGYEYVKKIAISDDDRITVVLKFEREITIGDKQITGPSVFNYLVVSFDNSLNVLGQSVISGDQEFDITSISKSQNKSITLAGWFSGTLVSGNTALESKNDVDCFQGKIDSNGKICWLKQYRVDGIDKAKALKADQEGLAYIVGTTIKGNFDSVGKAKEIPLNMNNIFIGVSDPDGKMSSLLYPAFGPDIDPVDIIKDDNSIWVLANFAGTATINGEELVSKGMGDILVIRYNTSTKNIQYNQLGGYGNDMASGLIKSGSDLIVTGWTTYELATASQTIKPSLMGPDVFIASFNKDCLPQSLISLKGDKIEYASSIVSNGSGIYIGGSFNGTISSTTTELKSRGEEDIFIAYIENCNASTPLNITSTLIDPKNASKGWELNAGDGYKSYSWDNGASQSQYYMVTKPGSYTVKAISTNGCEYTSSIAIIGTKSATLPPDLIAEHEFTIYPTITEGLVNWKPSTKWLQKEANIYVTTISGKIIWRSGISDLNDFTYSINLSDSPNGTYIVHISGDGFDESTKIIVKK